MLKLFEKLFGREEVLPLKSQAHPSDPNMPGKDPGNFVYVDQQKGAGQLLVRTRQWDGTVYETNLILTDPRSAYFNR